jgi:hypothetical protein
VISIDYLYDKQIRFILAAPKIESQSRRGVSPRLLSASKTELAVSPNRLIKRQRVTEQNFRILK